MVWSTQQELADARMEPTINPDSLYAKANGLVPKDPDHLLSNTAFLDALVAANQLTQTEAARILDTVERGTPLSADPEQNALFMGSLTQALLFSSLPETYAYQDIAEMLCRTGRLSNPDKVEQRLAETDEIIQAIIEGMQDGDGTGLHRSWLLGLRHDTLARLLGNVAVPPPNNLINQVGLAYTLLTFSTTPFTAFQRAGREIPDATHRQNWLRMWNVIGSLMGIGEQGLPMTTHDADGLATLIQSSPPYTATEQGHTLMITLMGAFPGTQPMFCLWGGVPLMTILGVACP